MKQFYHSVCDCYAQNEEAIHLLVFYAKECNVANERLAPFLEAKTLPEIETSLECLRNFIPCNVSIENLFENLGGKI